MFLYFLCGMQPSGRILIPPNMPADAPIYVNAKQCSAIIRRRHARAKAERENRLVKARKVSLNFQLSMDSFSFAILYISL
jgi:hypothetical protein